MKVLLTLFAIFLSPFILVAAFLIYISLLAIFITCIVPAISVIIVMALIMAIMEKFYDESNLQER